VATGGAGREEWVAIMVLFDREEPVFSRCAWPATKLGHTAILEDGAVVTDNGFGALLQYQSVCVLLVV
jgi:hypothetical protein